MHTGSNMSKGSNALVITNFTGHSNSSVVQACSTYVSLSFLPLPLRSAGSNQVQTQARVCPPMSLNWTVLLVPEGQCLLSFAALSSTIMAELRNVEHVPLYIDLPQPGHALEKGPRLETLYITDHFRCFRMFLQHLQKYDHL